MTESPAGPDSAHFRGRQQPTRPTDLSSDSAPCQAMAGHRPRPAPVRTAPLVKHPGQQPGAKVPLAGIRARGGQSREARAVLAKETAPRLMLEGRLILDGGVAGQGLDGV